MAKTLILGFGNADRQDDGVAWHVLAFLAKAWDIPVPDSPDDGLEATRGDIDLLFALQLYPEMAETIAGYDRVCFLDAHTGSVPDDVHIEELEPQYQKSPLTHHMTANTILELARTLYQVQPEARLVSVRGYEFGFSRDLSPRTLQLAQQAAEVIEKWCQPVGIQTENRPTSL